MAKIKPPKPGNVPDIASFDSTQKQFVAVADTFEKIGEQLDQLNGSLTLGGNTVGLLKRLDIRMPVAPWADATLVSPWVRFGTSTPTAQVMVEPGGRARMRGYVKTGVPGGIIRATPGPTWAPVGGQKSFACAASAYSVVTVDVNGNVYYDPTASPPNPATFLCLDTVEWECSVNPSTFLGTGWPMQVDHGFQKAGGVLVFSVIAADGNTGGVGMGAPIVDWQDLGNGKLRVNGVWGLAWGRSYRLLIYISPEEAD